MQKLIDHAPQIQSLSLGMLGGMERQALPRIDISNIDNLNCLKFLKLYGTVFTATPSVTAVFLNGLTDVFMWENPPSLIDFLSGSAYRDCGFSILGDRLSEFPNVRETYVLTEITPELVRTRHDSLRVATFSDMELTRIPEVCWSFASVSKLEFKVIHRNLRERFPKRTTMFKKILNLIFERFAPSSTQIKGFLFFYC